MGWFWAAPSPSLSSSILPPQHPALTSSTSPPPECPMHTPDTKSTSFPSQVNTTESPTSCPVKGTNHPLRALAQQPESQSQPIIPSSQPPQQESILSRYNPLNFIPKGLTNTAAPSQTHTLPLSREPSSIPRPDTSSTWEYPSPQQMYNAMLRKGYTDTDITAVESMVAVHNFLNEGAWSEIVEWEHIFASGLWSAWKTCQRGEEGIAAERARRDFQKARREQLGITSNSAQQKKSTSTPEPKLIRFIGRPQEPTPKSRIMTGLASTFPGFTSLSPTPPFDRHDWFVERSLPNGSKKEVRYVIDYYSGGEENGGEQVFYLDIRPALDTPTAIAERAMRWGGDVWWRASGGSAREQAKVAEQ